MLSSSPRLVCRRFRTILSSNCRGHFVLMKFVIILQTWHFCWVCSISMSIATFVQKKFDPNRAMRIGEAKNPGPPVQTVDSFSLTCGLINPTAVRGKEQQIIDLDCHVYGLAENSATTSTQRASSNQFAKHGYKSVWSPPVAAHQHVLREEDAKRGLASGVSIHSCLPCRPSRATLPEKRWSYPNGKCNNPDWTFAYPFHCFVWLSELSSTV